MADDPIAGKCPKCGADRRKSSAAWLEAWDCGTVRPVGQPLLDYTQTCEINALTAENSRLRVMAELLEQSFATLKLPNGKAIWKSAISEMWRVENDEDRYPTARAAIYAAMGWEKGEGT